MEFPQIKGLQTLAGSKGLIIPAAWISMHKIKKGDEVRIDIDENYNLIVSPIVIKEDEIIGKKNCV